MAGARGRIAMELALAVTDAPCTAGEDAIIKEVSKEESTSQWLR